MRKWIALVVAALLVTGGIYFGSPYLAARSLKAAAISGDSDKLDAAVDFPSVRESLKSQMSAALIRHMNGDPELQNNPFAGLGMIMVPSIVDRMVDTFVTADGIAALVQGNDPRGDKRAGQPENPDIVYVYDWVSLDRFRVKLSNKQSQQPGPSFLFERRGFASWKLIKLEIPEAALKGS